MKRGKKLGIYVAVLLLLVGGTVLAKNRESETIEAEEEDADITLFALDPDSLASLSWTSEGDTICLLKTDDGWEYQDDPSFPVSTAKANTLVDALREVSAERVIEAPDDMSAYGLDEPTCRILAETDDGAQATLLIGSGESLDGKHYISNGDGKVYLTGDRLEESFSYGLYDLVRKEAIPDMSTLKCMTVESAVQSYEIDRIPDSGIAYSDQYEWFLKDGENWIVLDTTLAEEFVDQVRILGWQECVDVHATEDTMEEYGLLDPAVTATVIYTESRQVATDILASDGEPVYDTVEEEQTFSLEIGDYTGSSCYARISGSSMVYKINSSVCDGLLYMSADDLRPKDVIRLDMGELSSIEAELDGNNFLFEKEVRNSVDEDGIESTETVYTLDGEDTAFLDALYDLNGMTGSNLADGVDPKRELLLRLCFHRDHETHPETVLSFYEYDSSNCLVTLDDQSTVFVSRYSLMSLMDRIRACTEPGEDTETES